ncbi:MAG: hypothetical protein ACYDAO_04185 [Thermoplasmataceae archaeon]
MRVVTDVNSVNGRLMVAMQFETIEEMEAQVRKLLGEQLKTFSYDIQFVKAPETAPKNIEIV